MMTFSLTKQQWGSVLYQHISRNYWKQRIIDAWKRRSVIWLSGVRRAGKTVLCQSLSNVEYFDCELPRIRQVLEDPESFLELTRGKSIVLDEIHRLNNPSELLKIAADHFPETKIIATGSSTLEASSKFKDTLTGRRERIWLTPMLIQEGKAFGNADLEHRFLFGGLPPFFLNMQVPERDFQDWVDSYWAKDIQELYRLEKRYSFQKFLELTLAQSGSVFEATRFTSPCEVSRNTIVNYLSVLEATHVAHVVRPFNTHRSNEIVSAPKVYGFDTGFVCYYKGWLNLRKEDLGVLWEHIVLNELQGQLQTKEIRYWRDKQDHELDFILLQTRNADPVVIECKWKATSFDPTNLKSFRQHYPGGNNFVVASDVDMTFQRQYGEINVSFISLSKLIDALTEKLNFTSYHNPYLIQ